MLKNALQIRKANIEDFTGIWQLLEPVFQKGDSYPHPPDMTKEEAYQAWMVIPRATYVVIKEKRIIGTYYIKVNQIGLGSHVCNSGYIVGEGARGVGLGRLMCEHSIKQAVKLGFKAMQFNLVVSTNEAAVHLWKSCGFQLIGTLPKAFNHIEKGYVDAYVMYAWLVESENGRM